MTSWWLGYRSLPQASNRPHKDIEIAVLRCHQLILQDYLRGWKFKKVIPKTGTRIPWVEGEWLGVPIHEIHAKKLNSELSHLEILSNESSGAEWRFRRNQDIVRPLRMFILHSKIGIPFMSPEIVLLYKAKKPNDYDEDDFSNVRDVLGKERQHWLKQAIKACYPRHPWLRFCNFYKNLNIIC